MAKEDKDQENDAPEAPKAPVSPAVAASRYVEVEVVDVEGYVKGVRTTLHSLRAAELAKLGKVKLCGEDADKSNKKAPGANKK